MRNIVLDTNCLLQCLPVKSPFHKIWTDILQGKIKLCVTTAILEEYEEVLAQKTTPFFADYVLRILLETTDIVIVETFFQMNFIDNDPDDNKFVDCAFAANAEFIVTNDKHYSVLKNVWPFITVINIVDFTKLLS